MLSRNATENVWNHRLASGLHIPTPLPPPASVVFIVDDDKSSQASLERLVATTGSYVECCSPEEFLGRPTPLVPSCLLLDVTLLGISRLDVQRRIANRAETPVIVIIGHNDVRVSVEAMKAGAVDVLMKPLDADALLSGVECAMEMSRSALLRNARTRMLVERYESLTRRERDVMRLVVTGLLNKQVGFDLGISEITVKAHRGQVMRKMKADSLADLVRMAAELRGHQPDRPGDWPAIVSTTGPRANDTMARSDWQGRSSQYSHSERRGPSRVS
jgi:FixJ family two-component response regulator